MKRVTYLTGIIFIALVLAVIGAGNRVTAHVVLYDPNTASGTYTIEVTFYGANATGSYTLSLSGASGGP